MAYQGAVSLMESGSYEDAISAFNKIRTYRDSAEKIADCHSQSNRHYTCPEGTSEADPG